MIFIFIYLFFLLLFVLFIFLLIYIFYFFFYCLFIFIMFFSSIEKRFVFYKEQVCQTDMQGDNLPSRRRQTGSFL